MYELHMHLTEVQQCGAVMQSNYVIKMLSGQDLFSTHFQFLIYYTNMFVCDSHVKNLNLSTQYTVYLHVFFFTNWTISFTSLQLSDGSDYTTRTQTLTFDQNNMAFNVTVPVLDNDIHEPMERFLGRLETEDGNTTLNPNSTLIRILDDDCKLHE